jgi:hypothetical protein
MGVRMPDLTDDAKKEIAEAIRIVREDKHDKMLREIHGRTVPPPDPTPDPNNPTPPPPTGNPGDPPPEGSKEKRGLMWGRTDEELWGPKT